MMNVSACRSVSEALQTAAAEKAAPGLMAVTERVLVVVNAASQLDAGLGVHGAKGQHDLESVEWQI